MPITSPHARQLETELRIALNSLNDLFKRGGEGQAEAYELIRRIRNFIKQMAPLLFVPVQPGEEKTGT